MLKRKNVILGLSILILHAPMIGHSACGTLDNDVCCEFLKGSPREYKTHLLNDSCKEKWSDFGEENGAVWRLLEEKNRLCLTRRKYKNCKGIKKKKRDCKKQTSDLGLAQKWCTSLGGKPVEKEKCREKSEIWLKNEVNNYLTCGTTL